MGGVYAEPWLKTVLLRAMIVRYKMVHVLFEINLQDLPLADRPETRDELTAIISRNYQWLKYAEELARFLHDEGILDHALDNRLQSILSQLEDRVYTCVESNLALIAACSSLESYCVESGYGF